MKSERNRAYCKEMRYSNNIKTACACMLLAITYIASCSSGETAFSESAWKNSVESTPVSSLYARHYSEGRFSNPWMPMDNKSILSVIGWKLSSSPEYEPEEMKFLPCVVPEAYRKIVSSKNRAFIVWLGHNTFLIKAAGQYWITDPMFSERALVPRRRTPPAISIDEARRLPGRINIVITHNHYDHLDEASVRALPAGSRSYVPLGLGEFARGLGKSDVVEMDWWDETAPEPGLKLVCLPAQHWSRRVTQGVNTTLWASYLLVTPEMTVYIGGDSGYFIGYREFGRRFPGIDYALMPTTAYHPRWFMHYAHMNVDESLRAFKELGARYFIPTQWGTFALGDEPPGYPAIDLERTVRERGLDRAKFIIPALGEIIAVR